MDLKEVRVYVGKINVVYDRALCRNVVYRIRNYAYQKTLGRGVITKTFAEETTPWSKQFSTISSYYSYTVFVSFVILVKL
jgi:hypothetical protein